MARRRVGGPDERAGPAPQSLWVSWMLTAPRFLGKLFHVVLRALRGKDYRNSRAEGRAENDAYKEAGIPCLLSGPHLHWLFPCAWF